jgi:PTH1 family peptidyl-tRNA hydrolase
MKMVAGLGNPGVKYARTRHNVGFRAVERLGERLGVALNRSKHDALMAETVCGGERVTLLMPQTFMNKSGVSLAKAMRNANATGSDLLVICDDVNLPLGKLRLRGQGSAGGQNGLRSIIVHLGTEEFARLRIGIGDKEGGDLSDHVLGTFRPDEQPLIEQAIDQAADAALAFLERGLEAAMNEYNGWAPA